jgi:hypothetical protein
MKKNVVLELHAHVHLFYASHDFLCSIALRRVVILCVTSWVRTVTSYQYCSSLYGLGCIPWAWCNVAASLAHLVWSLPLGPENEFQRSPAVRV